ncbi:MAG: GST-like protein, partial [Gammaproteobacteria bacterium]
RRLLRVLEQQLSKTEFIVGDQYSIADIAIFPWLRGARDFYNASDDFRMPEFIHTMAYLDHCLQRPAVQRGLVVPARE